MYNINWRRIVSTPMSSWWDFKATSALRFQWVPQSQVGKALSAKENEFGNVHQGVNLDKNKWAFLCKAPKKQVGAPFFLENCLGSQILRHTQVHYQVQGKPGSV